MPAITVDALRSQIRSGKMAPVYVLFGEDVRLKQTLVESIEHSVEEADRPFAVQRIFAGEEGGSPLDIAAAANVFPMLGDRRIVIVMRAERLLKPKRAGAAEAGADSDDKDNEEDSADGAMDTVPLEEYARNPSPSSVLVFVAEAIDRSRRLTKRVMETATAVEFGGLELKPERGRDADDIRRARREAAERVQREMAAAGKTIDPKTAELIVDRSGGLVNKLSRDLERLIVFTEGQKTVSKSDVEEVVTVDHVVDDWALTNALGDGDAAKALREVAVRLDHGQSPFQMLGQIRWWVTQRLAGMAPDRVKPAMEAVLRTDLALKSSGDPRLLMERLAVELSGKPAGQRPPIGRRF